MKFNQINQILEELKGAASYTEVSSIEKQILLNKIAEIYELLSTVNISAQTFHEEKSAVTNDVIKPEYPQIEEIVLEATVNKAEQHNVVEALIEDEVLLSKDKVEAQKIDHVESKKDESLLGKFENAANNSLNQRFVGQSKGLNERVAHGDLKKLIDFNRQFVFTHELFANDPTAYLEAINKLNDFSDVKEAFDYVVLELVPKYNWNMNSEVVKLFDSIIRQKFGV